MDLTVVVDELGAELKAAADELRVVSLEASQVRTPGVWVRVDGVSQVTLRGDWQIDAVAFLVVQATDTGRSWDKLATLLHKLTPTLSRVGYTGATITPTGLILSGSSTPLPALAIPLELHYTEEPA